VARNCFILFSITSIPTVGPIQLNTQCRIETLSSGVNWPRREAKPLPPLSVELKNVRKYISSTSYAFLFRTGTSLLLRAFQMFRKVHTPRGIKDSLSYLNNMRNFRLLICESYKLQSLYAVKICLSGTLISLFLPSVLH
jgi:hypothetical protein